MNRKNNFFIIGVGMTMSLLLTVAAGCSKGNESKVAHTGRRTIFGMEINDSVDDDTTDRHKTDTLHVEDRLPKADTEYVNIQSGNKWGFALGVSGDATQPLHIAHFMGNGMQGRDLYEMRPLGGSCYALYAEGQDNDCGITIFVYQGGDSIRVTRDGRFAVFKTVDALDEAVNINDPDYTPDRYAIKAGDNGGKWEQLQSGEITYVFPSGIYARNQWVKDGDKYYYVDASGCRMIDNYAYDGFYAGKDGEWDRTVKCIVKNVLPFNGKQYSGGEHELWTFNLAEHDNGVIDGTAEHIYLEPMDFTETFHVRSFGSSTYELVSEDDESNAWHLCVLDGGRTIRVSACGVTTSFHAN